MPPGFTGRILRRLLYLRRVEYLATGEDDSKNIVLFWIEFGGGCFNFSIECFVPGLDFYSQSPSIFKGNEIAGAILRNRSKNFIATSQEIGASSQFSNSPGFARRYFRPVRAPHLLAIFLLACKRATLFRAIFNLSRLADGTVRRNLFPASLTMSQMLCHNDTRLSCGRVSSGKAVVESTMPDLLTSDWAMPGASSTRAPAFLLP